MTIKMASSTHRWNPQGECRLCGCISSKKLATQPCPKAKLSPQRSPRTPDVQAASLAGARDLYPPPED